MQPLTPRNESVDHRTKQNQSEAREWQGKGYGYPYRPPVGAPSPDDAPFIFESSEEFPAGSKD